MIPSQPAPPTWLAHWRAVWRRYQAERIPAFTIAFFVALVIFGLALYWIERGRNDGIKSVEDALWWSIVTLTTTGYGDRYPITTAGRLVGSVAMIAGTVLVALVTAGLAAVLIEKRIKEGKGLTDASRLSGHVVILGWKSALPLLLSDLLRIDSQLSAERLVVVNLADELQIEALRSSFPGVVHIRGDIIDSVALQRANLPKASKVIILADVSEGRTDQERDARTVLSSMAVKAVAPDVYTCAEILDNKHAEHLRMARCDEVIPSREYSRSLLVGAALAAGITNVLHDLLDFTDAKGLLTEPIPRQFVGGSYGSLAAHLKKEGHLLIGLLENTGQALQIKRQALREAQKTTDVATLVENLRRVKGVQPNKPLLAPPDDYVLPTDALAIVIGRPRIRSAVSA